MEYRTVQLAMWDFVCPAWKDRLSRYLSNPHTHKNFFDWVNNFLSLGERADVKSQNFWNCFLVPVASVTLSMLKRTRAGTHPLWQCRWCGHPGSRGTGARAGSCDVSQSGCTFGCSGDSLRVTMVLCIFILVTTPDRSRPPMETLQGKGNFLSI